MDYNAVPLLDPATDQVMGEMDKLQAHVEGRYHAAISVLLFRTDGAQMLQKRALAKYHSGGLWANACCSHPAPGEPPAEAATRRLDEEMGIRVGLRPIGVIRYRAGVQDQSGARLVEHERVDLFAGAFDGPANPNPAEASDWRWIFHPSRDIDRGDELAPWFSLYLRIIKTGFLTGRQAPVDFGSFDLTRTGRHAGRLAPIASTLLQSRAKR